MKKKIRIFVVVDFFCRKEKVGSNQTEKVGSNLTAQGYKNFCREVNIIYRVVNNIYIPREVNNIYLPASRVVNNIYLPREVNNIYLPAGM